MMHPDLLRIVTGLTWSFGPYLYWRKELRSERQKRAIEERLTQVIRGY